MQLPDGLTPGGRFDEWAAATIEYCVADVDGTLVGRDNHPSPATVDAVARLQAAGVPVGVATGRMRLSAEPIARTVGAIGPHILHNGAEVRSSDGRLDAWPLTEAHLETIIAIGQELGAYAEIYVNDGFLVTRHDERAQPHWRLLGLDPLATIATVTDVVDVALKATFAVFDDEALATSVRSAVLAAGLRAGPSHSPVTPGIIYVNTTHPDADKGVALTVAARHAGTSLDRTAAIGDAPNDVPMLLLAGTAIAMGEASAEVRAAAHLVTTGVEAHGVAVALEAISRT